MSEYIPFVIFTSTSVRYGYLSKSVLFMYIRPWIPCSYRRDLTCLINITLNDSMGQPKLYQRHRLGRGTGCRTYPNRTCVLESSICICSDSLTLQGSWFYECKPRYKVGMSYHYTLPYPTNCKDSNTPQKDSETINNENIT